MDIIYSLLLFCQLIMVGLTKEQLASYDENGYIVLDLLTKDEIEEMSREYDNIFKRKSNFNLEATWKGQWDRPDGQSVSQILCYINVILLHIYSFPTDYRIVSVFSEA